MFQLGILTLTVELFTQILPAPNGLTDMRLEILAQQVNSRLSEVSTVRRLYPRTCDQEICSLRDRPRLSEQSPDQMSLLTSCSGHPGRRLVLQSRGSSLTSLLRTLRAAQRVCLSSPAGAPGLRKFSGSLNLPQFIMP